MLIENTEALKEWLTKHLEPICDADPVALAKYVVALVKKDKPEEELLKNCTDQLEVFLQDNTGEFVKVLFTVLKTKDYLNGSTAESTNAGEAVKGEEKKEGEEKAEIKEPNQENEIASDDRDRRRKPSPERDDRDRRRSPLRERRTSPHRRPISDRLGRRGDRRGGRRFDDRMSRRPAPYRDMDRHSRRFNDDRMDRHDDYRWREQRRRSLSPRRLSPRTGPKLQEKPVDNTENNENADKNVKNRDDETKPKSPDHLSARDRSDRELRSISRRRSRSPGRARSASKRRSRSRSYSPRSRSRSRSRSFPRRRSRSRSRDNFRNQRQRCRDFEEKGYCMQGDFCPYDHGSDPVVVEDINIPLPYNPAAPPGVGPMPGPPLPGVPPCGPPPHALPPGGPPPHIHPHDIRFRPPHMPPMVPADPPYNPEAPALAPPRFWGPPQGAPHAVRPPEGGLSQPMPRRDLVTVQTVPSTAPPTGDQRHVIATNRPPPMFKSGQSHGPYSGRGRGRGSYLRTMGPRHDYSNTTLEIRKIPVEMNNISKLNEHFAKFGTLVNVQIAYDGDREAALVSFATNKEASDAYRSSDPVFNNRFIKVFWHNKDNENTQSTGTDSHTTAQPPINTQVKPEIPPPDKLSLNNAQKKQEEKEKVIVNALKSGLITKTLYNTQVIKKKMAAMSENRAADSLKKKEEVLKKTQEIQKQKQDLLSKLLLEQKGLLERMDKNKATMGAEEKASLFKTIKSLATHIEKIKKEITVYQTENAKITPHVRTKQEAQKQILDAELELMAKEGSASSETSSLRKRLAELKREASHLGLGSVRGRGRGRGAMRGAYVGRGALRSRSSLCVDRRPRGLLVSGFDESDKEDLAKHFAYFGELESSEFLTDDQLVVTYKTRSNAENAYRSATRYKKKTLKVAWYKPPTTSNDGDGQDLVKKAEIETENCDDDEFSALDEDLLLAGDDMDDDDSVDDGDRSWRR